MSDDLRTLAQAVVDVPDDDAARYALGDWLDYPRDVRDTVCVSVARAILAALDAAYAQGYARAMGEVVALDEPDPCPICNVADWARERLPAAAERD